MGMTERCMEGMGHMMDGSPFFLVLPVLLFIWLLGLGVVAGVGVWAVRRFREQG
jgi:hypothetical protein